MGSWRRPARGLQPSRMAPLPLLELRARRAGLTACSRPEAHPLPPLAPGWLGISQLDAASSSSMLASSSNTGSGVGCAIATRCAPLCSAPTSQQVSGAPGACPEGGEVVSRSTQNAVGAWHQGNSPPGQRAKCLLSGVGRDGRALRGRTPDICPSMAGPPAPFTPAQALANCLWHAQGSAPISLQHESRLPR